MGANAETPVGRPHSQNVRNRQVSKKNNFGMFKDPQQGDLLMDVSQTASWRELQKFVHIKDYWAARVRAMTQPRVKVDTDPEMEPGGWALFTISM